MKKTQNFWLVLTAAFALSACSTIGSVGDVGTLWGEESSADKAEREALEARKNNKVPMEAVRALEVGRTTNGILLTAFGTAPGLGYSLPALRVRRGGRPANDGYLEFDFVATEPAPGLNLPRGDIRSRSVRADLPIDIRALQGVRGLRVHALQGEVQVNF